MTSNLKTSFKYSLVAAHSNTAHIFRFTLIQNIDRQINNLIHQTTKVVINYNMKEKKITRKIT